MLTQTASFLAVTIKFTHNSLPSPPQTNAPPPMAKYKYGFIKRSAEEVAKEEAETDRSLAYWENEVKKSKYYNKEKFERSERIAKWVLLAILFALFYMGIKGHK